MNLKEYIVVKTPTGRIDLWMTEMFEEVKRNHPPDYDNYRIITTFDPGEELKESGGMKTKEEILDKHIFNKFDDADRATFLAAMDEYAAQFAGTREDWISVEKELPGEDFEVLVCFSNHKDVIQAYYNPRNKIWYGSATVRDQMREGDCEDGELNEATNITHWSKLPNPPNTNILKPI